MTQFEPESAPFFQGSVTNLTVLDPGLAPTTIIKKTDPFNVVVDWTTTGFFGGMKTLGDHYRVNLFLEGLGTNWEGSIGTADVPMSSATQISGTQLDFTTGNIPVAALAAHPAGLYKLIVTIVHYSDAASTAPSGITGYDDGKLVQLKD